MNAQTKLEWNRTPDSTATPWCHLSINPSRSFIIRWKLDMNLNNEFIFRLLTTSHFYCYFYRHKRVSHRWRIPGKNSSDRVVALIILLNGSGYGRRFWAVINWTPLRRHCVLPIHVLLAVVASFLCVSLVFAVHRAELERPQPGAECHKSATNKRYSLYVTKNVIKRVFVFCKMLIGWKRGEEKTIIKKSRRSYIVRRKSTSWSNLPFN